MMKSFLHLMQVTFCYMLSQIYFIPERLQPRRIAGVKQHTMYCQPHRVAKLSDYGAIGCAGKNGSIQVAVDHGTVVSPQE